jgi:transposase
MARYKHYDYAQMKLLPVSFARQILPGTFEHTLHTLIDEHFDLTVFDAQYRNDDTGAPAYDPAILLKVILFAYSKGVTSSREIAQLCQDNVTFMALSADTTPHFTTIADFISRQQEQIISIYRDVLLVCYEQGLIGGQMFAVDEVKLPSNASKEWSGTLEEFQGKALKLEKALEQLLERHRQADVAQDSGQVHAARAQRINTLQGALDKVRGFLRRAEDKVGANGKVRKSNLTDPDSAKIKSSKGTIQGYSAMALVDDKHQVVVHAQAFGEGPSRACSFPCSKGCGRAMPSWASASSPSRTSSSPPMRDCTAKTISNTWPSDASTLTWPTPCLGNATCASLMPSATNRRRIPTRACYSGRKTSAALRTCPTASARRASGSTAMAATSPSRATEA